jgi:tRNA G18 (ribose-2'-O)-methylase SpoU
MNYPNYKEIREAASHNTWNVADQYKSIDNIADIRRAQQAATLPFAVCVVNVMGDLNVGSIIRTACIFGAERVIIFGRRNYDKRSTVGALNYIDIRRWDCPLDDPEARTLYDQVLAYHGYYPVFVEQDPRSIDVTNYNVRCGGKPCLTYGCEATGFPVDFVHDNDDCIIVPQRGVLRSLNVAAAAAITIHEISRKVADA